MTVVRRPASVDGAGGLVGNCAAGAGAEWESAAAVAVAADCPFCCWSGALSSVIRVLRIRRMKDISNHVYF